MKKINTKALAVVALIIVAFIVGYDVGLIKRVDKQIRHIEANINYYAHDTHVARCYRCALGQNISPADKNFCERNYNV